MFIHSWSVEEQNKITKLYQPKASVFEKQKDFTPDVNAVDPQHFLYHWERDRNYLFRGFSFFYTRGKSLELCQKHMESTGDTYDCVVVCRFDAGQRDRDQQREFYVSRVNFDPTNPMNYLYSALYDQLNAGMADQWFYSKPENVLPFTKMYDRVQAYLTPGSEYEKAATTGWPDSNFFKHPSPTDPRQFTNEVLKPQSERSKELAKYPRWDCVNNHLLHKWFLIEQGIYPTCKYLVG